MFGKNIQSQFLRLHGREIQGKLLATGQTSAIVDTLSSTFSRSELVLSAMFSNFMGTLMCVISTDEFHTPQNPQPHTHTLPLTLHLQSGRCPLHLGTASRWWSPAPPHRVQVTREGVQEEEVSSSHSIPPPQSPQRGFWPPGRSLDGGGGWGGGGVPKPSGVPGV